ncbi:MAG: DUF3224 domain-containing protein [Dehalococcoidia bacterium]
MAQETRKYPRYGLAALVVVTLLFLFVACTGDQGEIGPAGPAASAGPAGPTGPTGAQGAQGAVGPTGIDTGASVQGASQGASSLFDRKGASPYVVLGPPVFSGPPTEANGVTTVAGVVELETTGTQVGPSAIDFTCVVGADGAPNQCEGVLTFEGTFAGRSGSFLLNLEWIASGDAAFTDGTFKLISGSATGDLVDLVKWEGFMQRDETAGPNGIISGAYRFVELRGASPYVVLGPPVFSGPPTEVNGVTTVSGVVELETRGTQVGPSALDFTCVVGADGAPNQCDGILTFEGTFVGKPGSFLLDVEWTASGDAAFTDGTFRLIKDSGTGDLSDLVQWEGMMQRDETAGPNGIISGIYRFAQ